MILNPGGIAMLIDLATQRIDDQRNARKNAFVDRVDTAMRDHDTGSLQYVDLRHQLKNMNIVRHIFKLVERNICTDRHKKLIVFPAGKSIDQRSEELFAGLIPAYVQRSK